MPRKDAESKLQLTGQSSSEQAGSSADEKTRIRDSLLRMREMAQDEEILPVDNRRKDESNTSAHMFDMFSDSPVDELGDSALPTSKLVNAGAGNVDATDTEGYYVFRPGELLEGRYRVMNTMGKGVFSTVIRAQDVRSQQDFAVKAIRNNDVMLRAGQKEIAILKKLNETDPQGKRHCVKFLESFQHKGHLCLVFECLDVNLRELLRKYGSGRGISMQGVRIYASQMLSALYLLQKNKVIHADIKPDNIMVTKTKNAIKLGDFGSAFTTDEGMDVTPYLVSRFYRAPEIVLGLPYGHPIDIWSLGCCLFELYTGKIAFPGRSNNEMLKLFQEVCGAIPNKLIRKAQFRENHYDSSFRFIQREIDPVSKAEVERVVAVPQRPARDLKDAMLAAAEPSEKKHAALLSDLLDKMFVVDPSRRISVLNALKHDLFKPS
ncbi:hypothetical protein NDN08_007844 [Rhodosorus marinus]|uniref:non-specific serine/threonine protein kinase n=1 Tax=Rhodosorus marinus TaxID=101924 RepID=A0AAV8V1H8_9RHOD|nr:hypothetical protein NDN08_007844 [Rhodosorus marinus]